MVERPKYKHEAVVDGLFQADRPVPSPLENLCPASSGDLVCPATIQMNRSTVPATQTSCCETSCAATLRKAGLPPVRFHDLRHLAGTLMSEAAVPPKRAQEILGHAEYERPRRSTPHPEV